MAVYGTVMGWLMTVFILFWGVFAVFSRGDSGSRWWHLVPIKAAGIGALYGGWACVHLLTGVWFPWTPTMGRTLGSVALWTLAGVSVAMAAAIWWNREELRSWGSEPNRGDDFISESFADGPSDALSSYVQRRIVAYRHGWAVTAALLIGIAGLLGFAAIDVWVGSGSADRAWRGIARAAATYDTVVTRVVFGAAIVIGLCFAVKGLAGRDRDNVHVGAGIAGVAAALLLLSEAFDRVFA